jgi:hypothetical protein
MDLPRYSVILLEQDQENTAIKTDDGKVLQCISPGFKYEGMKLHKDSDDQSNNNTSCIQSNDHRVGRR